MARPREPINLLIAKGKKHLTHAEINARAEAEISAPCDDVKAPKYLPAKLRREFDKIAKQLMDIKIMTNLDVDALARFLIAREIYVTLSKQILKEPRLMMTDKYSQIAINQDKAFKQCAIAARDLGLTISSRCKIAIPKKEEEPESKWDAFRGGVVNG